VARQDGGLVFRRNILPQWRLDGGVYFVTWRLHNKGDELSPDERSTVADALKEMHEAHYFLSIFAVMDDHVHVLVQSYPGYDLSDVLKQWKGPTARAINLKRNRTGTLWLRSNRTDLMRNELAIRTRREYIYRNPQTKWGIASEEYPWLEWFE
jgi:REP element-mobilizing transposase RayT